MNRRVNRKGTPAEGACMKGIGRHKPAPESLELRTRLDELNLRLSEITVKDGKGMADPEETLKARIEAADRFFADEPQLAERFRFSIISQRIEERLF